MDDKRVAFRRGALTGGAVVLALAWIPMLSGPATGNQVTADRDVPHLIGVTPAPWRPSTEGDFPIIRAWSDGVLEVNFIGVMNGAYLGAPLLARTPIETNRKIPLAGSRFCPPPGETATAGPTSPQARDEMAPAHAPRSRDLIGAG